jgi:hypothetical protein
LFRNHINVLPRRNVAIFCNAVRNNWRPARFCLRIPNLVCTGGTMNKLLIAAVAALALPAAAQAQDTAPDGSRAFGLEPYIGIMGGGDVYAHQSEFGSNGRHGVMDGYLVSGLAGVNVPLGAFFVGAEGDIAKGTNDIDWEYGAKGRIGARAGETGLIYISAGYEWVNGKTSRGYPHRSDWIYGGGVEVGPHAFGMGSSTSGVRLRLQADTYNFRSIRPMAGIVFHM